MKYNFLSNYNTTGYGHAGTNFLRAALRLGHKIAPSSVESLSSRHFPEEHKDFLIHNWNSFSLPYKDAPCIKMYHQHDLMRNVGKGKMVGFPFFELDSFTKTELHHLSNQDALIVASEWAKQTLINNGITVPIVVAPLGVDRNIFNENIEPHQDKIYQNNNTKFLCIGKWEIRKGHDIVYQAFNRAFSKDDKVQLIMLCYNPFLTEEENIDWAKTYKYSNLGEKIFISKSRIDSQKEIASIIAACDCGVYISRAEAWNMELLETLSCGKQVICTNNTGHTQFINQQACMTIDLLNTETAYDGKFFNGFGKWPKFEEDNIDKIAEYMQVIHKMKQSNVLRENSHGIQIAQQHPWERTVSESMVACQ